MRVMKSITIMRCFFEDGSFSVNGVSFGFSDRFDFKDIFKDRILVKMMSDSVIVDDRKYQVMQRVGSDLMPAVHNEVWQAGKFEGWLKNCFHCGKLVIRTKEHISVTVDEMVLNESGECTGEVSGSDEHLVFCCKDCLNESLRSEIGHINLESIDG